MSSLRGFTPALPRYSELREVIVILDGVLKAQVTALISDIHLQTGTPQQTLDWTDPDTWIGERLSGESAELASRLWTESRLKVNPRYIRGSYYLINRHAIMDVDDNGRYRMSERSRAILRPDSEVIREIDEHEGMSQLLGILATKTRAKIGEVFPEWRELVEEHSSYRSDSGIRGLLRARLQNLLERRFIVRNGLTYSVTEVGIERAIPPGGRGTPMADSRREVARRILEHNEAQLARLRERLSTMDPYLFEHLVRDLLEAMGYQDVAVTSASGDRGVDVTATIEFGITTINEVVQVKRQQANVRRPIVDQLRGALPYHQAIRGTLMTLGGFSPGCAEAALFPGAAPISLIDGQRLVQLLADHEIGIKKRPAMLFEVDDEFFDQDEARQMEAESEEFDDPIA